MKPDLIQEIRVAGTLKRLLRSCGVTQKALATAAADQGVRAFASESSVSSLMRPVSAHGDRNPRYRLPARADLIWFASLLIQLDKNGALSHEDVDGLLTARALPPLKDAERNALFPSCECTPHLALVSDAATLGTGFRRLKQPLPTSGFHLFTVSGASGSGKDALLDEVVQQTGVMVLEKHTTRAARENERPYVVVHDEPADFERLYASGALVFRYAKHGNLYAFATKSLNRAISEGKPICAVFTEFELLPTVAAALRARQLPITPILVDVPIQSLRRRTRFRNLEESEIALRGLSIERDLRAIEEHRSEYLVVENGDNDRFNSAVRDVVTVIQNRPFASVVSSPISSSGDTPSSSRTMPSISAEKEPIVVERANQRAVKSRFRSSPG